MTAYRELRVNKNAGNGTVQLIDDLDGVVAAVSIAASEAPVKLQEEYVLNAYNSVAAASNRRLYGGARPPPGRF